MTELQYTSSRDTVASTKTFTPFENLAPVTSPMCCDGEVTVSHFLGQCPAIAQI